MSWYHGGKGLHNHLVTTGTHETRTWWLMLMHGLTPSFPTAKLCFYFLVVTYSWMINTGTEAPGYCFYIHFWTLNTLQICSKHNVMYSREVLFILKRIWHILVRIFPYFFFFFLPSFCKALWKFSLTTSVFLTDIWRSHDVGMKLSPSNCASRVYFAALFNTGNCFVFCL